MDEMRRLVADEQFEEMWLPFFTWALEQGAEVFLRAWAYAVAMGRFQRGERVVSFGGVEVPDLWNFLLAAAALGEMAQAAGFVALANECEQARAAIAGMAEITARLAMAAVVAG